MHNLISHFTSEVGSDPTTLNVDKFISDVEHVAPEVWEHVCLLTSSVNECKGRKAAVDEVFLGASSTSAEHTSSVFSYSVPMLNVAIRSMCNWQMWWSVVVALRS